MSSTVQEFVANQAIYDQRRRYLHKALRAIGFRLCNVDVTGLEHIPASGPTILMMNHISFIDPIIVTAVVPRRYVIAMAKAEAYKGWFTRGIINLWGNFVVNRGEVDRRALSSSIELLKSGQLLLIAPEGTRHPDGLGAPKEGIAYIAHKANAVIVPTAIMGAQDWKNRLKSFRKAYGRVHFGRPFRFTLPQSERLSKQIRHEMMQEAMYQIAQSMPEEYANQRGLYSDLSQATTNYLDFL
jgi:1-acyl-sn-glycerol-3-phosphate acyltransferase